MSLQAGIGVALAYFPHMYRHAAPMQVALAIAGSVSGLVAWLQGSGIVWLTGALLLGFVIPFTLLRIKPVNDRLLAPGLDPGVAETRELLQRWGRLHAVRSVSSTLAFLLFLCG